MQLAVLVVDMVEEFVTGNLGSPRAEKLIDGLKDLLKMARESKVPVIYLHDAHREGDSELAVWGEHAMDGAQSSEIVSGLRPEPVDLIIKKQVYSGFFESELEDTLRLLEVDSLIIIGVSTDICVQNNVADAFYRGFKIYVITDGTTTIDEGRHDYALNYMKKIYGANLIDLESAKKMITSSD